MRAIGQGLVLIIVATSLAGCAVAVDDPLPDSAAGAVCAGVMADLPATVLDQGRRTVRPGKLSAAWGSPPIVLRCGGPAPAALTSTSECVEVNGVGWFVEDARNGKIFTTIGRPAYVEVAVPSSYGLETGALVDLGGVVTAHDPVAKPCQ